MNDIRQILVKLVDDAKALHSNERRSTVASIDLIGKFDVVICNCKRY